jgi:hypothetical protein
VRAVALDQKDIQSGDGQPEHDSDASRAVVDHHDDRPGTAQAATRSVGHRAGGLAETGPSQLMPASV